MIVDNFTGGYDFLNPKYPSPITFDGLTYENLNSAMYAIRTEDRKLRELISISPNEDFETWNVPMDVDYDQFVDRLVDLMIQKFQNQRLGTQLLVAIDQETKVIFRDKSGLYGNNGDPNSRNLIGKIIELIVKYGTNRESILNNLEK